MEVNIRTMPSYILTPNDQLQLINKDTYTWVMNALQDGNPGVKFYANNFAEVQSIGSQLPKTLELDNAKNFTALQDHLLVSFTIPNEDLANSIKQIKACFQEAHFTRNFILFPVNTALTDEHSIELLLLIPTTQLITKEQHDWYIENGLLTLLRPALEKQFPEIYISKTSQFNRLIEPEQITNQRFYATRHQKENAYTIDQQVLKKEHLLLGQDDESTKKKKKKDDQTEIKYSDNKLQERLNDFIKEDHTADILRDDKQLRRMLSALANDQRSDSYPDNFKDQVLEKLATLRIIKRGDLNLKYAEEAARLNNNPDLRLSAPKFGEYLQIYKVDHRKQNQTLGQQLLSFIDKDFEVSAQVELDTAIQKIAENYPPALLESPGGQDKDNVVIFSPLTGMWIHSENEFYALLTALRPSSKAADLDTMMRTLGAQARNQNNFIRPYNRTDHYLFKNCVVERKTRKVHSLDESYVRDLHFTERSRLNIDYDPSVTEPPVFKNKLKFVEGGDWNPEAFMLAYAWNDPVKLKFLYFILALGLFGGHNSRVSVSFKGASRWGKTTLFEIFRNLHTHNFIDSFIKINSQFGFTSYKDDSSVIWFTECNTGIDPLNDTYGIPRYDNLADTQVSFEVKNNDDFTLKDPPQVFVDGTSFLPAKELNTGPAGRTLVFKFPMISADLNKQQFEALRNQSYANDINSLLANEKVLQYLVNKMMDAFDSALPFPEDKRDQRLDNLTLTVSGSSSDLKYMPKIEQVWRNEMISSQGDVGQWFKDEFEEYLVHTTDVKNATTMHDDLAYLFYRKSYLVRNEATDKFGNRIMGKDRFIRQLHGLYESNNWSIKYRRDRFGNLSRRTISNLSKTNFDVTRFCTDGNELPDKLDHNKNNGELPYPFGKRDRNWYELIKTTDKDDDQE